MVEGQHGGNGGEETDGGGDQRLGNAGSHHRQRGVLDAGEAVLVEEDVLGYSLQRLVPRRQPDLTLLTPLEIQTIDDVLGDLANLTAKQVSDLSHEDPAWRHTEDMQTIPYELALVAKEQVITPIAAELAEATALRYGISTVDA